MRTLTLKRFHIPMTLGLLMLVVSACNSSFAGGGSNGRPEGEFSYDCSPRPDDPNRYLVAVCQYLNLNQIWVGDFSDFRTETLQELEDEHGRAVIEVHLSCCGTGDVAGLDEETGEVLYYQLGIY